MRVISTTLISNIFLKIVLLEILYHYFLVYYIRNAIEIGCALVAFNPGERDAGRPKSALHEVQPGIDLPGIASITLFTDQNDAEDESPAFTY